MNITLINGRVEEIKIVSDEAKKHFDNPNSYALFILEEWKTQPYADYILPNSIILDIGANVGLFGLHVKPFAKRLICVEPTPEHMRIQREILEAEHEQAALNYYTGKAKFRTEPVNTTMNTLRDADDAYEVDCITLKDLCTKYNLTHVDFCKIDIEGSEFQAVTTERLKEVKGIIKSFFIELHPRSLESQNEFKKRFEEAGYEVKLIDYNGSLYCYEA